MKAKIGGREEKKKKEETVSVQAIPVQQNPNQKNCLEYGFYQVIISTNQRVLKQNMIKRY